MYEDSSTTQGIAKNEPHYLGAEKGRTAKNEAGKSLF
jgi:hypothetical protein